MSVDPPSGAAYLDDAVKKPPKFCSRCGHPLEEARLEGRQRMRCPRCGTVAYRNPVPATAVIAQNGDGGLLLVRRATAPCPGRWCLPGGFVEADEPAEKAAARELKEETGLEGDPVELVDVEYHLSLMHGPLLIIGYRFEVSGGSLQAGDDAADAKWFKPGCLPAVAFSAHRRLIRKACPEMLSPLPVHTGSPPHE